MSSIVTKPGLAAFFEQEHHDCNARWADVEELLATNDIETARPAWVKFDASLRKHIAMEEEVIFPAFEAASGTGDEDSTEMMRMEHQQMVRLLEVIGKAVDTGGTEEAMDAGDQLLILIQQHNAAEEVFYPRAENLLGPDWADPASMLEKH